MVGVNREILGGELHVVSQRESARRGLPSLTVRGSSAGMVDGEDVGSGDDGSAEVPTTADETVNDMPISTSDALEEAETLSDEALSGDESSSLTETLTETVSNKTFTDLNLPEAVLSRFDGHSITEPSTPAEPSTTNLNLPPTSLSASELASVPGSAIFGPAGLSTLTACLEVLRLAAEADPEARRLEDSGLDDEIQAWAKSRGAVDEGKAAGESEGGELAGAVAEAGGGVGGGAGTGSETGSKTGSETGVHDKEETRVAYECRALVRRGLGHLAQLASARDSSRVETSAARKSEAAEGLLARNRRSGEVRKVLGGGGGGKDESDKADVFVDSKVLVEQDRELVRVRRQLLWQFLSSLIPLLSLSPSISLSPHHRRGGSIWAGCHSHLFPWPAVRSSKRSTNSHTHLPLALPASLPASLPVSSPTTAGEVASGLGAILTYSLGQLPTRANTQVITVRKASRFLKAFQKWQHTDVVVWVKTTYKRMAIRPPTSLLAPLLLPYHPRWHTLARSIAAALPHPFIALHFRSEYIAWLVGGKQQQEQKKGKQVHWCVAGARKLQQEQKIGKQMHWCVAEAARTVHQVQQQLSKGMEGTPAEGSNASSGDSPSHHSRSGVSGQVRRNTSMHTSMGISQSSSSPSVFISADIAFGAAAAAASAAAPADAASPAEEVWPVRSESWGVMVEKYGREQTIEATSETSQKLSKSETSQKLSKSETSQKLSNSEASPKADEEWPARSESWGVMVEKYGREQTIEAGHRALLQLRALVDDGGDAYKGDGYIDARESRSMSRFLYAVAILALFIASSGAVPIPAASAPAAYPTSGTPTPRLRGSSAGGGGGSGAVRKPNAPSTVPATVKSAGVKSTGSKPTGPDPTGNKTNGGNPRGASSKPTDTKPNSGSPSPSKPEEKTNSTVAPTNKKSPSKPAENTAAKPAEKSAAKPAGGTAPSAKKPVTVQSSANESQRQRMVGARISAAGQGGSASWLVQNGGATCDISVGTWIPSSTRPAYASTCPYISSKFNCVQNGRPDGGYQHLMWQPRDCNMTLFSPLHFALMFRDKSLAIVGDSNAEYLFRPSALPTALTLTLTFPPRLSPLFTLSLSDSPLCTSRSCFKTRRSRSWATRTRSMFSALLAAAFRAHVSRQDTRARGRLERRVSLPVAALSAQHGPRNRGEISLQCGSELLLRCGNSRFLKIWKNPSHDAEYLFQSLRCQLSTGLETETVNTTTAGVEASRVISSNTLVLLVVLPLVSTHIPPVPLRSLTPLAEREYDNGGSGGIQSDQLQHSRAAR
ncbi:unnamed protein product [Closterium sp. NIES-54]